MEQTWESLFSEQAGIEGHSQQYISECLAYAGILHSHNVPVIFDKCHFQFSSIFTCFLSNFLGKSTETRRLTDSRSSMDDGNKH